MTVTNVAMKDGIYCGRKVGKSMHTLVWFVCYTAAVVAI